MENLSEPEQESRWQFSQTARRFGVLALTASIFATAAWQYKQIHSGERIVIAPENPSRVAPDQNIRVISWNIHNEVAESTGQIADLLEENTPDALLLQEVGADDIDNLHTALPGWYITYVNADIKDNILNGGLGNAIITEQKLKSIKTTKVDGTSFVESAVGAISGLAGDLAHADTSLNRAKDGIQANRTIVAGTLKYNDGNKNQDLRIVTGHLSGDSTVKEKQFDDFLKFLEKDSKKGRPTIACLDLNRPPSKLIIEANKIGFLTGLVGKPTSDGKRFAIDHCVYSGVEKIGLDITTLLPKYKKDHVAIDQQFNVGVSESTSPNT